MSKSKVLIAGQLITGSAVGASTAYTHSSKGNQGHKSGYVSGAITVVVLHISHYLFIIVMSFEVMA